MLPSHWSFDGIILVRTLQRSVLPFAYHIRWRASYDILMAVCQQAVYGKNISIRYKTFILSALTLPTRLFESHFHPISHQYRTSLAFDT